MRKLAIFAFLLLLSTPVMAGDNVITIDAALTGKGLSVALGHTWVGKDEYSIKIGCQVARRDCFKLAVGNSIDYATISDDDPDAYPLGNGVVANIRMTGVSTSNPNVQVSGVYFVYKKD